MGGNGAEIKSAFLTMLHVTPEYIVVVSNPEEIIVDEDESEIILPLRCYIAAKRTSRELWQRGCCCSLTTATCSVCPSLPKQYEMSNQ